MIIILITLCILIIKQYQKAGVTTSLIIMLMYLISVAFGLIYTAIYPDEVSRNHMLSMVYYAICILLFFVPLIKNNTTYNTLQVNTVSIPYVSYIVAICGIIIIYSDIINFDFGRLSLSWVDQRNEYYVNYAEDDIIASSWYDRIASNGRHIQFLSLPLFFYYIYRKEKKMIFLMGASSLSICANSIMNASRQEFILWCVGAIYSYLYFRPCFSERLQIKIKVLLVAIVSIITIVVLTISISRFGDSSDHGLLNSFYLYAGIQPYNAATFLEDLHTQAQWGDINFPYLFGHPAIRRINDVISAPYYLNVFGSIVGSFYLDFGYFTIFFVLVYSLFFTKILEHYRKKNSFAYIYLYMLYCDIIFSGIFYYRYISSEKIRSIVILLIVIEICEHFKQRKYDRCLSYNNNL